VVTSLAIVDEQPKPLSAEDRATLLRIARKAIEEYLDAGTMLAHETDSPTLKEARAAFVTLRRRADGELRGCRGECNARRSLLESVIRMAIASATDDSRFVPVTIEELPDLHIEISALTTMRPIEPQDVEVGRHGLWIVQGFYTGLLLPQVAVRFGWDREQFLSGVCRKAGLAVDAWKAEGVQLLGFETEVWEEE
jgi:AmmeMemoRadiSam system protein A